jgi:hypothetical protein
MSRPPHSPWFNQPNNIRWRIQAVKFRGHIYVKYRLTRGNREKCTRLSATAGELLYLAACNFVCHISDISANILQVLCTVAEMLVQVPVAPVQPTGEFWIFTPLWQSGARLAQWYICVLEASSCSTNLSWNWIKISRFEVSFDKIFKCCCFPTEVGLTAKGNVITCKAYVGLLDTVSVLNEDISNKCVTKIPIQAM